MSKRKLLILDDEPDVGHMIKLMAEDSGLEARAVNGSADFFRELEEWKPEFISVDLVMPNVDGVELLRLLARHQSDVKVVLMSGVGKRVMETAAELGDTLGLNVIGHLPKPFRKHDFEEVFRDAEMAVSRKAIQIRPEPVIPDEDLVRAIECREFVNHYQPQVNLLTGEAVGIEALIRWQHPLHGLIFPDAFIGRLEALELINELGSIAAEIGFRDFAALHAKGLGLSSLSLNISIHSLRDLEFPDRMRILARNAGVDPTNAVLEITESGLLTDLTKSLDVLARLRMKGFGLSIDDFGTGYSMMRQLKTIPANELKIDRAFVQNALKSMSDRVMVTKTIEIGHELGMRVVAEGVETAEHSEFVSAAGAELAQGYYFCRPQPLDRLSEWLRARPPNSPPAPGGRGSSIEGSVAEVEALHPAGTP